jgi:hypothetical protein
MASEGVSHVSLLVNPRGAAKSGAECRRAKERGGEGKGRERDTDADDAGCGLGGMWIVDAGLWMQDGLDGLDMWMCGWGSIAQEKCPKRVQWKVISYPIHVLQQVLNV